jgi:cell division protease FtsH
LLDEEVRRIIGECFEEARAKLEAHRPRLDALAAALLEHETLDEEAAYTAAGLPWQPDRERAASRNGASAHTRSATD